MLVWGGESGFGVTENTGAMYDPGSDSWAPITTTGAPASRALHTAVWTGSRMLVWGGAGAGVFDTGAQYDPATDSWSAITTAGAPSARFDHTAIWTGSRMLIWGGGGPGGSVTNTPGGQYDPASDSWTAVTTTGAPSARQSHTAVWTGLRMLVWGGLDADGLNTGAQYDPAADSWSATTTIGAPSGRFNHTAVWTGSRMLVWGGGSLGALAGKGQGLGGLYLRLHLFVKN